MNKTRVITLVAITIIMLVGTMTMASVNVKATTEEDDGPALTIEKRSSNPSGEKVLDIQSSEASANAAVKIEKSQDHSVRQGSAAPDDEPAHTSTKTVERGDTITEITKESSSQSSRAASNQNDNFAFFGDDTADQR